LFEDGACPKASPFRGDLGPILLNGPALPFLAKVYCLTLRARTPTEPAPGVPKIFFYEAKLDRDGSIVTALKGSGFDV
jgi:hypothetical protein